MLFTHLRFTSLLKQKNLLHNQLHNNLKKNLYNKVNNMLENDFKNEYINKKQLKITNSTSTSTCCKYCKGTGWIIWKTNNNLYELKTNKLLAPTLSYSLCFKCSNL